MVKKYENYKDSGIEWIGDIPEHWEVKRLKFLVDIIPSNVDKKSKEDEQSVLLCNYVDVYKNDYINEDISFMHATASDSQIDKLTLLQNDVIATKDSEDPNDIGVPALVIKNLGNVVCGYHLTLFRSKNENEFGKYLFWYLKSNNCSQYFSTIARGITRYALGTSAFSNLAIPKLDEIEYILIANYLDRKTTEIDDLIAKKERLIALYKEERTATINQAVTCGLDQHGNLRQRPQCLPAEGWKDSGIEWLGEIPEHWEVKKMKFVTSLKSGVGITSEQIKKEKNGLHPVYGGNGLRGYFEEYTHSGNYILIGRQGALCGNINYAHGEFWATEHAVVCSLVEGINWIWFGKLLEIMNLNQYSQASAQPGLAVDKIKNLHIPIPSDIEQNKISKFVEKHLLVSDQLVSRIVKEIELLKEYKTALISEVVLGKVDVREEVFV